MSTYRYRAHRPNSGGSTRRVRAVAWMDYASIILGIIGMQKHRE